MAQEEAGIKRGLNRKVGRVELKCYENKGEKYRWGMGRSGRGGDQSKPSLHENTMRELVNSNLLAS